ncbi:hypothetical protein BCR34DRAFT_283360 [Clohesyomyces aquaticus]|uniref:Uncharacterized protein n=1 Tax=Clohesyomyces aquaticus TaxID=1231657 RepID=A0A1Y1Y0H2_9PLEO|nr:hypothetical protein BCR34DRAFT_283360 [Clohesyomyces aquaticus]
MPPPALPTGLSRISDFTLPNAYAQLPKIFLLVLAVASCLRYAVVHCIRRKRRETEAHVKFEEKARTCIQTLPEKPSKPSEIAPPKDSTPLSLTSVYPWTSPPKALPGPYDPRLYPLPTIRRHSYPHPPQESTDQTTISYTRRISTNSIPARQIILRGTVTTAKNEASGWRRNQWVVEGG